MKFPIPEQDLSSMGSIVELPRLYTVSSKRHKSDHFFMYDAEAGSYLHKKGPSGEANRVDLMLFFDFDWSKDDHQHPLREEDKQRIIAILELLETDSLYEIKVVQLTENIAGHEIKSYGDITNAYELALQVTGPKMNGVLIPVSLKPSPDAIAVSVVYHEVTEDDIEKGIFLQEELGEIRTYRTVFAHHHIQEISQERVEVRTMIPIDSV